MIRGMIICTGYKYWKFYYYISISVYFFCLKESIDIRGFFLWSLLLIVLKCFIFVFKIIVLIMYYKVYSNFFSRY